MKNILLNIKKNYQVRLAVKEDSNEITKLEEQAFNEDSHSVSFNTELKYENKYHLLLVRNIIQNNNRIIKTVKKLLKFSSIFSIRFNQSIEDDFISGFIGIWFYPKESYISTFAVREFERGKGLGELLLIYAIVSVINNGGESMSLEVRQSNFQAIELYKKFGFHKVGIRKFYYSNNKEDAAIMTVSDINTFDYKNRILYLINNHSDKWGMLDKLNMLS